ncbi:MAG TPA: phage integrase N-terminal SAM-like domain-containing protein [Flavobacterium sp.]|jgi:integrase/recombinase XerD
MIWKAKIITHKAESRIAIVCIKDARFDLVRDYLDVRWSNTRKLWHVPDSEENRYKLSLEIPLIPYPSPEGLQQMERFRQWLGSRRYSESTVRSYLEAVRAFLSFYNDRYIEDLTNHDIIVYNNEYILKNKFSASY